MEWITANWAEIGVVLGFIIAAANVIARITPTETDNKVLAAIGKLASVVGIKVPDNPGKPNE
jgi:hypothetical protein